MGAPIADVWTAISTPEGWQSWAVPLARMVEDEPDMLETSYDPAAPPGGPGTIRQLFVARIPGRLLAFRTVKAPQGFPDFETYSRVVSIFELEPRGPGSTFVRLTAHPYPDDEAGRRLLGFFERGNRSTLDALKARFARTAPAAPLRAELEPLRFLLGHCWRGEFKNGSTDLHCFESVYGGQHVRDRHEVTGPDAPYRGETLYSWDGAAKRVGYTYWNSSGGSAGAR